MMTWYESKKNSYVSFWSLFAVYLVFACSAEAIDKPITPGMREFNLIIGNKTVGKIRAVVNFNIVYHTSDNNEKLFANFSLDNNTFKVSGSQDSSKTVFNITGTTDDAKKSKVEWTLTFTKDSKNGVTLTESTLRLNIKDWPNATTDFITVKWTDPITLTTSANAYTCSNVKLSNENGSVVMKNVAIQPFDLKNGDFGPTFLCNQDQPQPGDWTVTQRSSDGGNFYTCIRMQGFLYLGINYTMNSGNTSTVVVPVPSAAIVAPGSTCNYNFENGTVVADADQVLTLHFPQNGNMWSVTIRFTNRNACVGSKQVEGYRVNLDLFYDDQTFPDMKNPPKGKTSLENNVNETNCQGALQLFKTSNDHSYRCNANETTTVVPTFAVTTSKLRVEAYLSNSTSLLTEHVCYLDQQNETSDLIPIIIGAALAALVVVVLIAYLIGRARARGSNYETI